MIEYLEVDDLLTAAEQFLGERPAVRDHGLIQSAVGRPQATWLGEDVYPDLDAKAAALLLSLVTNHGLVDGNKRLGWVGVRLFYVLNGYDLRVPHDDAYELVMQIADGSLDDVPKVADTLRWHRSPL